MNLAMQLKVKLAMVIVCMLCYQSLGQLSCMPFVTSLSSCMSYIMGNATAPTPLCCSNLADVIQTQARCLCTVLNSGAAQLGIPVNQTQALTLPGVCSVTVPALSQCTGMVLNSKRNITRTYLSLIVLKRLCCSSCCRNNTRSSGTNFLCNSIVTTSISGNCFSINTNKPFSY
ncbi:Plant non-specific lipid-transfer protein/Par allergen protein [Dioscorea alata]|uniref:Plant non-specific lipid-transfer protein/Par allergen protein n=1 Tax=Dioscorea alata TaxID=55571 RepID=A0ACB7UM87_DIOAL|nr:Plant non-specific lipid-transfer protein/Par allergen protein [Dioscorea alata]